MRIFVTAHRGDTSVEPEHTLAAYQAAVARGADAVEVCVRLSADGVAVARRYAYLDDDTTLSGPVHARDWSQLATARIGPKHRPLSRLRDVVAALDGEVDLEIQLKSAEPELVPAVLAALTRANLDRVHITCAQALMLSTVAAAEPSLVRCLLVPPTAPWAGLDVVAHEAVQRARLSRADAVHLRPSQVTAAVLERLDDASLAVHVWDANEPADVRALHALGLTRFCTNRLDDLVRLRDEIGGEPGC